MGCMIMKTETIFVRTPEDELEDLIVEHDGWEAVEDRLFKESAREITAEDKMLASSRGVLILEHEAMLEFLLSMCGDDRV